MTKLRFPGVLACTIALAATPSIQAGERQLRHVAIIDIGDTGAWASGNAGDVFNSQDRVETIWCQVMGVNIVIGICFARDAKGRTLTCHSFEETIIRPMLAVNGDSTIAFFVDRLGGFCSRVDVTNGSYAAPKRQTTPEDHAPIDTTGNSNEVFTP